MQGTEKRYGEMGPEATTGRTERRHRWHRTLTLRRALVAAVVLLTGGVALAATQPAEVASAAAPAHATLVADLPTTTTPHVLDGDVRSVAVAGDTVVLGGNFTQATDPDGTRVDRRHLLAFDRTTGRILRDWAPQLDNEVYSVVASPDGQSIYVGGRFNSVDGVTQLKVAKLATSDGRVLPFRSGVNAVVTSLAIANDRLYVGGVFQQIQGRQRRLAALDLDTGDIDDRVAVDIQGVHRTGGDGKIWRIEPSPDGQHLLVVGSFATVDGQPRNQIVKLDTNGGGTMTVDPWSTTAFAGYCASFQDYVRDVSYSPDGSYFVVVTTGAKGTGLNGTCDSVSRWAESSQAGAGYQWIQYSGGDSHYSVEITGSAVYVGGHFRWSNNPYGTDSLGPGGVETTGISSLDPANGLPLSWNPGRDRGRAVWQLVATPDGLYVASDTDRIANYRYRGRIAFFPLEGGRPVPQPARQTLPLALDQYVPSGGGQPARVVSRDYDGSTFGTVAPAVGDASALAGTRSAFFANGVLYTAMSNGTLLARSYDGSTLGAPVTVDLQRMTAFASDLANMTSSVYDGGKLYYTVSGSNTLYMRYFSTENRVVGAVRYDAATSGGGVTYSQVGGMVLAGNDVYYVDRQAGTLVRAPGRAAGGIDGGGRTTVAPAGAGGVSWTSTVLWARQGEVPNQAPTARFTFSCTGLDCSFDASGSTDGDGTITNVTWDFGDGQTASGPTATHRYGAAGTYSAVATVTDDDGATGLATSSVTVEALAPQASFTTSCADDVCAVDASASADPDGTIASYAWDFGDGQTATGETAAVTYAADGTYTVRLTVTDDQGLTNSTTRTVTATVPAGRGFIGTDAATSQSTSLRDTVTVPTDVREGDQLLLFAASNAKGTDGLDAPAGWTRVLDGTTSNSRSALFARTATATDAGSTVEVTTSVYARTDVVIAAYRGVALTLGGQTAVQGYTTPSRPATAGSYVLSFWADKTATTTTWTPPPGVTVRHSFAGTGAGHVSEMLADNVATADGPTPQLTAGVDQPSAQSIATTVVLRPV